MELISREQAIDAIEAEKIAHGQYLTSSYVGYEMAENVVKQLPPILPGKDKVSDLLYHIYSIQSPHLDVTGVVAKKYYCEELWKELFGKESELPGWMT